MAIYRFQGCAIVVENHKGKMMVSKAMMMPNVVIISQMVVVFSMMEKTQTPRNNKGIRNIIYVEHTACFLLSKVF